MQKENPFVSSNDIQNTLSQYFLKPKFEGLFAAFILLSLVFYLFLSLYFTLFLDDERVFEPNTVISCVGRFFFN